VCSLRRAAIGAFTAAVLAWAPSVAAQDVTGPTLVDCTVAPTTIDVTGGPANGSWTFEATDDLSGVASAAAIFVDPGFGIFVPANADATDLVAGDALAGTWSTTFDVAEFSPSGTWTVFALTLIDADGNSTAVPVGSLPSTCRFDVTSLPDTAPPTLDALSATPGAVDVTLGAAGLTLTTTLEDDRSGVGHATIKFESPTGKETVDAEITPAHLIAGDALSGTYTAPFEMPQLAENGTWSVASVRIVDVYGYVTDLDGAALGVPSPPTIDVSSASDTTPPQVVWFTATPSPVYLGASPPMVELMLRIRDDVSGFGPSGLLLESPVEGIAQAVVLDASHRVSGTTLDGIYVAEVEFEPDAPTGAWGVSISVADPAGNSTQYQAGAIPGPQQIVVTTGTPPPTPVPVAGLPGVAVLMLFLIGTGTHRALRGGGA